MFVLFCCRFWFFQLFFCWDKVLVIQFWFQFCKELKRKIYAVGTSLYLSLKHTQTHTHTLSLFLSLYLSLPASQEGFSKCLSTLALKLPSTAILSLAGISDKCPCRLSLFYNFFLDICDNEYLKTVGSPLPAYFPIS